MLENMKVVSITTSDIANGPGVRCTVWVSGCSHKCPGCHNPELANYDYGKYKLLSPEVFETIEKELNKDYIEGITFSGGDPLDQDKRSIRELRTILGWIKEHWPNKKIWVYTGGLIEDLVKVPVIVSTLRFVDVLVDGPFILEKRDITIPFRGSTNQRIIDVQKTLEDKNVVEIPDKIFQL